MSVSIYSIRIYVQAAATLTITAFAILFNMQSAYAQITSACAPVERFTNKADFLSSQNLAQFIAKSLEPSQTRETLNTLNSSNDLVEYMSKDPSWLKLGDMDAPSVLAEALNHVKAGNIVVASSQNPNRQFAQAAVLTSSQLYSSSTWRNGTPAAVYYHPFNKARSFAGCKLSHVWRGPTNVKLFALNKTNIGAPTTIARAQNSVASTINIIPPPPIKAQPSAVKPQSFADDPVYEADVILSDLKKRSSVDTRGFKFNGCVYLHGFKGWVSEWENLNEAERVDLAEFLTKVPTKKLHGESDASQNTHQFVIGPLCDCKSYTKTAQLVDRYNFELLGILRDEDHNLKSCLRLGN